MSRRTTLRISITAFGLGIALFLIGGIGIFGVGDPSDPGVTDATAAAVSAGPEAAIVKLKRQVDRVPKDYVSWASLGLAYVEQARITVNPDLYTNAEAALQRSLRLNTSDNYVAASGMAALAAGRHDFATSRDWANKGLVINPSSAALYGSLGDALTQLGDYDGARVAIQKMLNLSPDTSSLTRASYSWELRGDIDRAQALMQRARNAASTPTDIAFTERYLGELDFNAGNPAAALDHYQAGLLAFPTDVFCLEGRAKANAALGNADDAIRDYDKVIALGAEPSFVLAYGEYLQSLGRTRDAKAQFDQFAAEVKKFQANGEQPDIDQTLYLADHGDPAAALRAGQAGIASRAFLEMHDAHAWALYANGRHAEAKEASNKSLALGTRHALLYFHAGMIDLALGDTDSARTNLTTALDINPHFSPRLVPLARQTLVQLRT